MISAEVILTDASLAVRAEIALLGVSLPDLEDVGEGGVRATCTTCDGYWDMFDEGNGPAPNPPWKTTDYEVGALEAYVQHVRTDHLALVRKATGG